MKIEILGPGCPKCKKVAELTEQAVKESGVEAEIIKVNSIKEIMNRGVIFTPALVIDGEVKSTGKIPGIEEIKNWLKK
ncbi:MAG: thioredoxin family protein [bacterium (Candidatus Ratteibacteria) CG_4_9_14_3_um_filter_41_21]|uniref:Thioredoxin family protein n=3 Tax=Candidatus Ratteibacteria TaxID=2979319 RepID=A0A2M7YGC0_9BACT|nr:MAG: thioredoxin family protein [bacterium (Candidatus Ratteibacteria) CG01_land_8_20_14_3_00_40_19]PIW33504.1 MAG: thioredoxin family protein [bacterium (Candidatus Ratteibacteria) CG15_BIG_FIL_POST_REV_8_21_14_020_41_12]PJA62017.1 MAG: thioredoxin family protein [bacterium (Candidatus Ratteibacteria) CG_4_9_14_3_um_filter_41_21]HCG76731.1 thioredoxin family protein [bacterium]